MRIKFKALKIRDFKEYRGRHVLDLSGLGLGLHYVKGRNRVHALGSNGAGKSSLWDAFSWCLTGKTTRGLRGTDVRTWEGDEHAIVSVWFYADDKLHVVKRSTSKNGLWLDAMQTSQEEIERLVGLNAINIPHTIILGQKRDLFFDLLPQVKLNVLSETLQLDKWEERSKRAKERADEFKTAVAQYSSRSVSLDESLNEQLDMLSKIKKKSRSWEDERSQGSDTRERDIVKLKKDYTKAESERGQFDLAYDSAETELRALRRDMAKKGEEFQEIADKVARTAASINAKTDRLEELKTIRETCPTCGQTIKDAAKAKEHARKERIVLRTEIDTLQALHDKRTSRKTKIGKALMIMRKSEEKFGKKSDEAKDRYDQLTNRMAELDKSIAVLKAQDRSGDVNPYEESIQSARKKIKETRALIAEIAEQTSKASRLEARTRYWVQGFKLLRLHLLQELLEELQEVTQNMLPDFGLADWAIQYDIERETKTGGTSSGINVKILKPGMTKSVRWETWSGGENQRLLVVGALAVSEVLLRHAGIECDMIILDEPTRHMSKEGVTDLVDHLIGLGKNKQVVYCDHQAIESTRFASIITITKNEGGSSIDVNQG